MSEVTDQKDENTKSSLASAFVKYAAAISIAFSVMSFAANWILFAFWGINYTAAVAPADVIIGALEIVGIFIPFAALGVPAYFLGGMIPPKSEARFLLYSLLNTIAISAANFLHNPAYESVFNIFELSGFWVIDAAALWSISIFFFAAMYRSKEYFQKYKFNILMIYIPINLYLLLAAFMNGVLERSDRLQIYGESERCGDVEFVVWVGAERVITTCSAPPYSSKQEYFILVKDDLQMRAAPIQQEPN